jgi:bifunctional NMN adenylyltransferase/nudix hydrolase
MKTKNEYKVGVVVGRFQVPELHEGHKKLISMAQINHERCIVFIACTEVKGSDRDPLDYDTRAAMVKYQFPGVIVKPIHDNPSDHVWSQELDGEIIKTVGRKTVMLYASKGGFASCYHGRYKICNVPEVDFYRGTELREIRGKIVPTTKEGRCGVIYGIVNQYPRLFQTVDMAVVKIESGKPYILLGIKKNMEGLRFPGGFVDQSDESLEDAAKREVYEECGGINTDDYEYVCSGIVDDWRYRNRPEKVMSSLFKCTYMWGPYDEACKKPDSEFTKLAFYPVDRKTSEKMADTHKPAFIKFMSWIGKRKERNTDGESTN